MSDHPVHLLGLTPAVPAGFRFESDTPKPVLTGSHVTLSDLPPQRRPCVRQDRARRSVRFTRLSASTPAIGPISALPGLSQAARLALRSSRRLGDQMAQTCRQYWWNLQGGCRLNFNCDGMDQDSV